MSYISMNVTEQTRKKIEEKLEELQDSLVTDDVIEEVFLSERRNLVRSAINEEMQRKGFKQIFVKAIDNIIAKQLNNAEESLKVAYITSDECGISKGQIWVKDDLEVIVTGVTPNIVKYSNIIEGAAQPLTKLKTLHDFIKEYAYKGKNVLVGSHFWSKKGTDSVILVKDIDKKGLVSFINTTVLPDELSKSSSMYEKHIAQAKEKIADETIKWSNMELQVLLTDYCSSTEIPAM